MIKNLKSIFLVFVIVFVFSIKAFANNLNISNVSFGERNPAAGTLVVEFDLSWENSWKTKINHDAVWLTVRLNDTNVTPTNKKLCQLVNSGVNPTGISLGSSIGVEVAVPTDKLGVIVRPSVYANKSSVTITNLQITLDYASCGFDTNSNVSASVFGIEMVYVPQGDFYAGDYGVSSASFVEGSSDNDPWHINSENIITVSNDVSNGFRYISNGNISEDVTGSSFTIGANFPKGYDSFYIMKYEITEGQWVEFINSLPTAAARAARDITNSSHKNSDSVLSRNTISCSGSPLICTTQRPARALNYISWMDFAAFLDWSALRPISELEFEKVSRGPLLPEDGEYAWGSINIIQALVLSSGAENGSETVSPSNANAHYGNVSLTGGDSVNGVNYATGPLRSGIFATSSSTREKAGAGYYGVMALSGNLREMVVTVGNAYGRNFQATNGNGVLSSVSGFEGNATNLDWPGINATSARGVTGALGSGLRGGGWSDSSDYLRISDRKLGAYSVSDALSNVGGRGARAY